MERSPQSLVFRVHAIRRMFERRISEEDIRHVPGTGEVVEDYPDEEEKMRCVICRQGETKSGTATVTLERQGTTLVIKDVPAKVCENCGEEFVDEEIARRLLQCAEEAASTGVQVDIRRYHAA